MPAIHFNSKPHQHKLHPNSIHTPTTLTLSETITFAIQSHKYIKYPCLTYMSYKYKPTLLPSLTPQHIIISNSIQSIEDVESTNMPPSPSLTSSICSSLPPQHIDPISKLHQPQRQPQAPVRPLPPSHLRIKRHIPRRTLHGRVKQPIQRRLPLLQRPVSNQPDELHRTMHQAFQHNESLVTCYYVKPCQYIKLAVRPLVRRGVFSGQGLRYGQLHVLA